MFKTIHECGMKLISYTMRRSDGDCDNDCYHHATDEYLVPAEDLPVRAARASFGKQDKTGLNPQADHKLAMYLAEHKHLTPFEYQHATFLIECPLFIRSQIHRHRTFSYNEISRRYTDENLAFWVPDTVRAQSTDNKQASDGLVSEQEFAMDEFEVSAHYALGVYNTLIKVGTCREQARAILPQSLLTQFYMGGTLRNWQHFIELRRDPHAQYEVQVIANRIAEHLRALWPDSCEALGI